MRTLYTLVWTTWLALTAPLCALQRRRGRRRAGQHRALLDERSGILPASLAATPGERTLWIHAVSVGEVAAARPLVAELRRTLPGCRIALSTRTGSGRIAAAQLIGADNVFFLPHDHPRLMRRALQTIQPEAVLLLENELWPNLMAECRLANVPVVLVNATIEDRSRRRWPLLRPLWSEAAGSADLVLVPSERQRSRWLELGADPARTRLTGSLKFDVETPVETPLTALLAAHLPRRCMLLVCGSTDTGEEKIVLRAWEQARVLFPEAMILLAPRRAARFDFVEALSTQRKYRVVRLSRWREHPAPLAPDGVLLLDTIGDLASVYRLARVAFIGGSFTPLGGHNPLEPARFSVPVLMGPEDANVCEIAAVLREAGGLRTVSASDFPTALEEWLGDTRAAHKAGALGCAVLATHRGAAREAAQAIAQMLAIRSGML